MSLTKRSLLESLIVKVDLLTKEFRTMSTAVDTETAASTALRADVASLVTLVTQLIALADADKAALVQAIANSGISAADAATLQASADANTAARASIAAAAQAIADALVRDAPAN